MSLILVSLTLAGNASALKDGDLAPGTRIDNPAPMLDDWLVTGDDQINVGDVVALMRAVVDLQVLRGPIDDFEMRLSDLESALGTHVANPAAHHVAYTDDADERSEGGVKPCPAILPGPHPIPGQRMGTTRTSTQVTAEATERGPQVVEARRAGVEAVAWTWSRTAVHPQQAARSRGSASSFEVRRAV